MIVLGVDPGTLATGWGVVVAEPRQPIRHVAHGVVRTRADDPLWDRLAFIDAALAAVIAEHRPDALSLEQCFVSKNVQSALKLGHTRGVIMVAARRAGADVFEYTPGQVKSAVTGNGRAEKHQVAEMVRIILGLAAAAASDASDALAAAICHGNGHASRALTAAVVGIARRAPPAAASAASGVGSRRLPGGSAIPLAAASAASGGGSRRLPGGSE